MNLSNFKIGTRLGLGFALVLLLLAGITVLGITRLSFLSNGTGKIVNDAYPKVVLAYQIKDLVNQNARSMRNLLLFSDPAEIKREQQRLVEAKQENGGNFKKIELLVKSAEGKALLQAVKDARATYVEGQKEFLKLVDDGEKEKAVALLLTRIRTDQNTYFGALEALIQHQTGSVIEQGRQATDANQSARGTMLVLAVLALVLGAIIALWITRSITRPLREAVKVAQTVAVGDLSSRIEVHSKDETGLLLQALRDMNSSLCKVVSEVRSGTDTIATVSSQIAVGNQDLSSRTEEQAGALEETAASMEELASTMQQNTDYAHQANQLALLASNVAAKGGHAVSQVVGTMDSINASSRKIADIIGVIDGIAFQTNILALNAAVEAARAGEQGRGFAVVATEVRNLAQRSAVAAKEIRTLIGDSVNKVEEGSKQVADAGKTMAEIVDSIKRVTAIMAEIAAASHEQTVGMGQINQAVTQMDQVTQQNAALVEESAAVANSLQAQAEQLVQAVAVFKLPSSDIHFGEESCAASQARKIA